MATCVLRQCAEIPRGGISSSLEDQLPVRAVLSLPCSARRLFLSTLSASL